MIFEENMIGAEEAAKLLRFNHGNRPMKKATVSRYKRDMLSDRWTLTAEAIQIAVGGRLINGQHRLSALIEADKEQPGIKIPFTFAFEVPEESFARIDQGPGRTGGQTLSAKGFINASNVNSASKIFLMYLRYNNLFQWSNDNVPTQSEVEEWIDENTDLVRDSNFEGYPKFMAKKLPVRVSTMMALKMAVDLYSTNPEKFQEFSDAIATGANLSPGDPRLVLRERSQERIKATQWGYNGNQSELGVLLKAWNAFVAGKTVSTRKLSFSQKELPLPRPL